jgi:hypothetical protein
MNDDNRLWWAHLSDGATPALRSAFGVEKVPLVSPVSVEREGPYGKMEFYHIDANRLTPEQLEILAADVVERFGLAKQEVLRDMQGGHGIPVRAGFLRVAFSLRAFM